MKEDITELKRLADVMLGTEHCDREKIKSKLSKMMAKYSKFTSVYEQRNNLISRAVRMYRGLEEVSRSDCMCVCVYLDSHCTGFHFQIVILDYISA